MTTERELRGHPPPRPVRGRERRSALGPPDQQEDGAWTYAFADGASRFLEAGSAKDAALALAWRFYVG